MSNPVASELLVTEIRRRHSRLLYIIPVQPELIFNWLPGRAWEPMSRGSASLAVANRKLEAEPPGSVLPGSAWERVDEYNNVI